jgi:YVTN family beta-propeller protein
MNMNSTKAERYRVRLRHVWLLLGMLLVALPLTARILVYVDYEPTEAVVESEKVGGNSAPPLVASQGDIIDVIDPVTYKVVQKIKGIDTPHGFAFSPDGRRVYVTSESEDVLAIVNQESGEIIKKVPLSGRGHNMVITKDGGRIFVDIYQEPGVLDIIDTKSLERVRSIPMGGPMYDIALTPDGKYVVANTHRLGNVRKFVVVDVQTEQPVWEVKFDSPLNNMAIEANPDGSTLRVFVTRHGLRGFDVVDFAERKVVAEIKLPETAASRGSWTKGPATKEEVEHIVGKNVTQDHGIGVSPDNSSFWINNELDHCVYVYSLPDLKLLGHVPLGKRPNWLAFSPDGKQVYDVNTGEHTMSIIDVKTRKEVARIPIGGQSGRIPFKVSALELR